MKAIKPLLEAVFPALRNSLSLMNMITGVYDDVPSTATYDYVVVQALDATPWDTFSEEGDEVVLLVHVWSDYRGAKEALEIGAEVQAVLDKQPLAVVGWDLVSLRRESWTLLEVESADGDLRHGILRMRALLQKAAA